MICTVFPHHHGGPVDRTLPAVAQMLQRWAERGDRNGCVLHNHKPNFADLFALLTEAEYDRFKALVEGIVARDGGRNPPCMRGKLSWPPYGNANRGIGECIFLAWVIEALLIVLELVPAPAEATT